MVDLIGTLLADRVDSANILTAVATRLLFERADTAAKTPASKQPDVQPDTHHPSTSTPSVAAAKDQSREQRDAEPRTHAVSAADSRKGSTDSTASEDRPKPAGTKETPADEYVRDVANMSVSCDHARRLCISSRGF